MRRNLNSLDENLDNDISAEKPRKMTKVKLIKDLNHKTNAIFHDAKINSNKIPTNQNLDLVLKQSRPRHNKNNYNNSSGFSSNDNNLESDNYIKVPIEIEKRRRDGQVSFQDAKGNKFNGLYQNGIRVSGKMIYTNENCEYEGSFLGEKFHGHGKLTYYNGRTIEGEWQDQALIGGAIINYPNGDVYYGDVNQKLYKHGMGHLFLKNGDKYIGRFSNGSITGFGTYYHQQKITAKGHWVRGKLVKQIATGQQHLIDSCSFNQNEENTLEVRERQKTKLKSNMSNQEESMCCSVSSNLRLKISQSSKNESQNFKEPSKSRLFTFLEIKI